MKITSKEQAFEILDSQPYNIPFDAIEFLYNHPVDQEIAEKIITSLNLTYTEHYYVEDLDITLYTPLWYMVVAEKYLDLNLLDAIIRIASIEDVDSEFIDDQISFLTGAICEKHGHIAVEKVLNTIEGLIAKDSVAPYMNLFDCLVYIDEKIHFDQVLRILEHPNNTFIDSFAFRIGDNQYTSFLPALKKIIKRMRLRKDSDFFFKLTINSLGEVVEELETGVLIDPEGALPTHKSRGNWKEYFNDFEDCFTEENYVFGNDLFNDDDDDFFPSSHFLNKKIEPIKNTKKVGRNQPCPCGSGKKYKKCCL